MEGFLQAERKKKAELNREKNIAFKATKSEDSDIDDDEMAFLTKNFKKIVMKQDVELVLLAGPEARLEHVTSVTRPIIWSRIAHSGKQNGRRRRLTEK